MQELKMFIYLFHILFDFASYELVTFRGTEFTRNVKPWINVTYRLSSLHDWKFSRNKMFPRNTVS